MIFVLLLSYLYVKTIMERSKNLKITPKTHKALKAYCKKNSLKMFAFVENLINEKCKPQKGIYDED